ncbi:SURF1 family protein [Rhizobium binae]|uniref:SURF1 family protein n=1 Tax=Rhizobium binae TaxID=1138190 RepID=UPI001C83A405|nr:SURF1 family protein [Rhizobium binae]MBX4937651.1 SURF1 family protein [Rhizobium binae]MBX4944170.1 SURF1 family protein [Rhizobium binae]MBX4952269.1 SURF1 family protein [Rhizobium binae]MBX4979401.1 SURF1 family protein [Rhizobium binae]
MTDIDRAAPRRRLPVITGILVLIALAILITLGTWQLQRLHWKQGLLADIAARQAAAPVPLADIEAMAASGGDIEYRKVTATGRYINNKERHFFATWRGQTGFYVYTPLELADGRVLFVNRGFVPYENKEPEMRMQGQLTDQQTVTGLARAKLPGKPSSLVPDNDVAKNIFYWKDLDVMAESVGLETGRVIPFFVDADSTPNPAGLPIGGVTQVDLPNDHLQYALTWYGLAAVLVVVVAISWFRKPGKTSSQ